jgi:glycerol-3-phosphate acyltransferase PlsX
VVCDGFTGNVILKVAEGLGEMVIGILREEARKSPVYGAGLLMAKGAFRNLKRKVDYTEYGGAPLLGVNGACLIGHGRSTPKALRNAIRFANSYASSGVILQIGEKILEILENPTQGGTRNNA